MIYIVYGSFIVAIIFIFLLTYSVSEKFSDKNTMIKVIKENKPTVLTDSRLILDDNDDNNVMNKNTQRVITKIRALDNNSTKTKKSFLQNLNYKLTYIYGESFVRKFMILYCKVIVCSLAISLILGVSYFYSIIISLILSIVISIILVNHFFNKKIAHFLNNFGYALDIIVRGVRTGLSINDCFKQIVNESEHIVAEQFLVILDDYKIGLNTEQAMERFMKRMPMKEVYFFGLSITVQAKTGGNLAEIIDNLSKVLKNRKSILLKIKTLSSEAKTSAIIMGSLPLFIIGILSMIAPDYLKPLFDTFIGNMVLVGCAIWMSIGGLIMRSMINFYR